MRLQETGQSTPVIVFHDYERVWSANWPRIIFFQEVLRVRPLAKSSSDNPSSDDFVDLEYRDMPSELATLCHLVRKSKNGGPWRQIVDWILQNRDLLPNPKLWEYVAAAVEKYLHEENL
jgi:hypothetical protein